MTNWRRILSYKLVSVDLSDCTDSEERNRRIEEVIKRHTEMMDNSTGVSDEMIAELHKINNYKKMLH